MPQKDNLRVYSAGAVAPPLQKAIDIFEDKFEIPCSLTVGKPSSLLAAIAVSKQGDVISCGAEYILDEAEDRGLVVKGSRRSMGFRRSVIIVPIGNPAKITSLNDLCKESVHIGIATDGCLKGVWDDVASKAGLTNQICQKSQKQRPFNEPIRPPSRLVQNLFFLPALSPTLTPKPIRRQIEGLG